MKVRRQDEPLLIQAIKELCDGNPTENTHAFLRSLDRQVADETDPVMLFGTNFDVDFWNQEKLDSMPGQAKMYRSIDSGMMKICLNLHFNSFSNLLINVCVVFPLPVTASVR